MKQDDVGKNNLTDVVKLNGIPIFQVGEYPQGKFDIEFLQQLADSYDPEFHEAPVYLNHEDENGRRPAGGLAFGWIKHLYVKGRTLFADIVDVPRSFAELILSGRIKKRSVEIYRDLQGKGPYLRALAWPMIPQVKGLADVHPSHIFTEQRTDRKKCGTASSLATDSAYFVCIDGLCLGDNFGESEQENEMVQEEKKFITNEEFEIGLKEAKREIIDELRNMLAELEIKSFCEQMVLAGKMSPAERQTEQPILISQRQRELLSNFSESNSQIDIENVTNNSETGEQMSLVAQRMEYYRNRKPIVRIDEIGKAELSESSAVTGDNVRDQKIVRYFHENKDFFTRLNVSVDDLIEAERYVHSNTNPLLS